MTRRTKNTFNAVPRRSSADVQYQLTSFILVAILTSGSVSAMPPSEQGSASNVTEVVTSPFEVHHVQLAPYWLSAQADARLRQSVKHMAKFEERECRRIYPESL